MGSPAVVLSQSSFASAPNRHPGTVEIGAKPVSEPEAAALCGALKEAGDTLTNGGEPGVKLKATEAWFAA
jgi:hypothetical protein